MAETTGIAWTDATFNAWIGCTKVDPGCDHCYAEKQNAYRKWNGGEWGPGAPRKIMSEAYWRQPHNWNRAALKAGRRMRVFCSSLADWADKEAPAGQRERLFQTIRETPYLDWLLLSKGWDQVPKLIQQHTGVDGLPAWGAGWPNVWLGATVADRKGEWRVKELRKVPAVVHFVSAEPLLEDISKIDLSGLPGLWVIGGGESGPCADSGGPRLVGDDVYRRLRDATHAAGGKYFQKQLGGHPDKRDTTEDFPGDLRVREFPLEPTIPEAAALFAALKNKGSRSLPVLR